MLRVPRHRSWGEMLILIFLIILSQKAAVRIGVWLLKTSTLESQGSLFSFPHSRCAYTRDIDMRV